jgi:type III restriction enzyme
LFAINYSATPGTGAEDTPNTVFKLSPVDAFKLDLVKKIQVWGITEDYNVNDPQLSLALEAIAQGSSGLAARFRTLINEKGKLLEKKVELKKNEELFSKTKNEAHRGLKIEHIDKKNGVVSFTNGEEIVLREDAVQVSVSKLEILKAQIERTITEHFARQKALRKQGIKVLSLFFIDRVANYVSGDGIIRKMFDEAFERLKSKDDFFKKLKSEEVREGYFAKKKTKKDEEFVDTAMEEEKKTKEQKELEKQAYELIMKDKEKLLSFDAKVCFIFAHSALREGWDNPNVFQICTLNTATSDNRRRQEIGRGLRLCVNQHGERVQDEGVNILTVVANESYRSFVENLQKEYIESGDLDYPLPSNAAKTNAKRNEKVFENKAFREFWKMLCQRTSYNIKIDSEQLKQDCIAAFNNHQFYFPEPRIVITKGQFIITNYDIELLDVKVGMARLRLKITDTHGSNFDIVTPWLKKGADLSLLANRDERLKPYKIVQITGSDNDAQVKFGNNKLLTRFEPVHFQMEKSVETDPKLVQEQQTTYPVFNLIDRASKELTLTRPTILAIFKGIEERKKETIFKNPEGFAAVFIAEIREILADHIAEKIEYTVNDSYEEFDLQEAFPEQRKYPQKELIDGSKNSLYDQIQVDSDVEMRFVQLRVQPEDERGNIVCYFKFPNTFKVNIPRIIGNYNPDWGIIRLDEKGKPTLRLVRETKGNTDTSKLRFTNEGRKIECAEKHFAAIGVDYRTIDDKIGNWWVSK